MPNARAPIVGEDGRERFVTNGLSVARPPARSGESGARVYGGVVKKSKSEKISKKLKKQRLLERERERERVAREENARLGSLVPI